jgi:Mn-dependent DtxR family transcriptional regulator
MNRTDLEGEILIQILVGGDDAPKGIAQSIDRPSKSVSRALSRLQEEGLVRPKGAGVWTLTNAGVQVAQNLHSQDD